MGTHRHRLALLLVPFVLVACAENPTEVHDDELSVELTLSTSHVHILSPVTFTATVRDGHGELVTNMDTLRVERRTVGSDTWRTAAELTLTGSQYTGEYTFLSSGEYELRIMGMRQGHSMMEEMVASPALEHVHAVPAHAEAGGYRIEFEAFPGHIHENDQVEVVFWIMQTERDPVTDERPPIAGLAAEIFCLEADGATESHVAAEAVEGEYTATHTFLSAGDGSAEIRFTGSDGLEATASFPLHVVHAH